MTDITKPIQNRYVICHADFGVYLSHTPNGIYWSRMVADPNNEFNAPTFLNMDEAAEYIVKTFGIGSEFPKYYLALCFPDRPDNTASRLALKNHCLPA